MAVVISNLRPLDLPRQKRRALARSLHRALLRARAKDRAKAGGMTLIEIMIVMVLMSCVIGGVVMGGGQLSSVKLKKSASGLTGAIKVAFTRATATSKSERLVFDFEDNSMWLEEADAPMLVQSKDTTGTGGASPVTDAERAALEAGEQIIKGVTIPRPMFHPVVAQGIGGAEGAAKGPQKLPSPIHFREIQTAHDDAPRTTGRAYLYFWPGGLTERASIQLRVGTSAEPNETMTLVVAPLTGKATIKNGPVALKMPVDDVEASDRTDNNASP